MLCFCVCWFVCWDSYVWFVGTLTSPCKDAIPASAAWSSVMLVPEERACLPVLWPTNYVSLHTHIDTYTRSYTQIITYTHTHIHTCNHMQIQGCEFKEGDIIMKGFGHLEQACVGSGYWDAFGRCLIFLNCVICVCFMFVTWCVYCFIFVLLLFGGLPKLA
jgi:hypothetical protein